MTWIGIITDLLSAKPGALLVAGVVFVVVVALHANSPSFKAYKAKQVALRDASNRVDVAGPDEGDDKRVD